MDVIAIGPPTIWLEHQTHIHNSLCISWPQFKYKPKYDGTLGLVMSLGFLISPPPQSTPLFVLTCRCQNTYCISHDTHNLFMIMSDVILHPDHKPEGWAIFTLQGLGHWTHIPPLCSPGKPQCSPQWKPCLNQIMEAFVYFKHKWEAETNK